jgi:hypothetical protein
MIGSVKSANKMCAAFIARMNLATKTGVASKQGKPGRTIFV